MDKQAKNKKKNVLMFVLNDCNPDKRVLKLAQTLLKSNFNVKIIATHFNKQNKKKEKLKNGLIIERISILPLPFIKYFHFWIKSLIFYRNQNEDILVCHDLNVLPIGTYLKSKNKSKLVYDSHEFFPSLIEQSQGMVGFWIYASLEKLFIYSADFFITVTESLAKYMKWYYKLKMPVNYITNAPNKSIAYLPVDNRYKEDNDFSLALVGIISAKNRGFELVPDIATQLKKLRKKDDPNVKIIILGDGPFKEEFEKMVKTAKHEDIIKILGFFPYEQAMSISKSCDIGIIIVPAISIHNIYSGPNRLYECLGNYQPFITSDVYEFARIAFNQNCGWVAPTNDPEVFAKMILDIARDKKTILEKKENAKNNFLNKYNWEVMEEKINKIYQNL